VVSSTMTVQCLGRLVDESFKFLTRFTATDGLIDDIEEEGDLFPRTARVAWSLWKSAPTTRASPTSL